MTSMLSPLRQALRRKALETRAGEDAGVVRRCREGELKAFEELVRRYRGMAMRIAMGYLRNEAEAVDASQDAFVRALEGLPAFDEGRPFFPWFHAILRNLCLNRLRRLRRRGELPLEEGSAGLGSEGRPEEDPRADALEVRSALAGLKSEHQEVLLLRHWEDLSYEAMASALGLPLGTVMSRLHGARRALRRALEKP